jgi:hypothetical protein
MAKFSNTAPKVKTPKSVIATVALDEGEAQPTTYEGRKGGKRTAKSELFMLAIRNMVGESNFYESAADRDKRFNDLIAKVAAEADGPEWLARFVPYLRGTMNMRSASIVLAAETVRALLGKELPEGVNLRSIVDSAIVRADEPAEMIGYWKSRYTGTVPKPIKRGVADAIIRLAHEKNALKYDGQSRDIRMADVIELVRPTPKDDSQSRLFKWLIDRRHNREDVDVTGLPVLEQWTLLQGLPQGERREFHKNGPDVFKNAGFTWEMLSGWIGGEMTAEAWETIIPSMGYMALLRNLRNFEKAGISDKSRAYVIKKLTDPEEVARSRQFPFRFYSAFKNTESLHYASAIEQALDLSVQNIPSLKGKTLVLVDLSGSMDSPISAKSKVTNSQVGALFGAALAARTGEVTLVGFGTTSKEVHIPKGTSVLKLTDSVHNAGVGHGTETFPAIQKHYDGHKRIVIFTDQQSFGPRAYNYGSAGSHKFVDDLKIPIYNFDLGGYKTPQFEMGKDNRYEFGGFTDQAFLMLALLEEKGDVAWPF